MPSKSLGLVALLLSLSSTMSLADPGPRNGETPAFAGQSCQDLYEKGIHLSGVYYINPDGNKVITAYCYMETPGEGWTLVFNSVLGTNTTDFWNIPYAERLGRRGRPSLDSNFYDGSLYVYRTRASVNAVQYIDVIEDLRGKIVVVFKAKVAGFDPNTMKFQTPELLNGHALIYSQQFAMGWSSPDHDGDELPERQCSTEYMNVTQHYGDCFYYSLGADGGGAPGDVDLEDGRVGPHLYSSIATQLQLASDGTKYTRVRRISRFVRW